MSPKRKVSKIICINKRKEPPAVITAGGSFQERLAAAVIVVASAAAVVAAEESAIVAAAAAKNEDKKDYPCAVIASHCRDLLSFLHQHTMAKGQNRLQKKYKFYYTKSEYK